MKRLVRSALLGVLMVGVLSCEARTDRTDTGGVALSVSDFDGLPIAFSVSSNCEFTSLCFLQVDSLTVRSTILNANAPNSDLMDVEIKSYQVTYRRLDTGARVPRPLVEGQFGIVPRGGTMTIDNLVVAGPEQLLNAPLSDLLLVNGGFDKETGSPVIKLELALTFFGKTLSGDDVVTEPAKFAVSFSS
ncbi:MAG TPA: hypothetical protein VN923_14730 [Thermoanaerobaculia bacterium]|nr:hypothetical protein [Thermoanaerobaculia bacterium]